MVERAERLQATATAGSHDGIAAGHVESGDQKAKPLGRHSWHITGEDQGPALLRVPEGGFDPAQRTTTGKVLVEDAQPKRGVILRAANNGDISGRGQSLCGDVFDESPAGEGQERLVPAHPAADAAGQDESRHPHDTMVAVRSVPLAGKKGSRFRRFPLWKNCGSRYNQKNIVPLICFLLPLAAAVSAEPSIRVTSTVRADTRTGRLVRKTVVAPAPVAPVAAAPMQVRPAVVPAQELAPKVVEPAPAKMLDNLDVNAVVEQTALAHAVDPLLVHSVIKAESNYNPAAISPKGAMGLMQLMPGTARRFGAYSSFDVRQNIEAGVKYLKHLQQKFQDDRLALAAYNAGEGAVLRYGNIPPYRETEQYVYQVGKNYGEALRRKSQAAPGSVSNHAAAGGASPAGEPLRQLEIARDAEGRIILRTR